MENTFLCDYHIHSRYSSDSTEEPESIINTAINRGLNQICFTDHTDLDYPECEEYPSPAFVFDINKYFDELTILRDKYKDKIDIKIGVELGLMPYLADRNKEIANKYDWDFIIGSSHLIRGIDPYFESYWKGKKTDDVINDYFNETLLNVKSFDDYCVYGHIDYITRYIPDKTYVYDWHNFSDIIDEILKVIIARGHGIELNYSLINKGLPNPNPLPDILSRYKELGGEIITIGSDSHVHTNVGKNSEKMLNLLKSLGYKYITTYNKKKPSMVSI